MASKTFKVGDKVKVVCKGCASYGWVGTVSFVRGEHKAWPYMVAFGSRDMGEYAACELALA